MPSVLGCAGTWRTIDVLRALDLDRRNLARAVPVLGAASAYCAAAAVLSTALFVWLGHLGNQIPYPLAQERFRVEAAADRTDEGYSEHYKIRYEYCEIWAAVLAGARSAADGDSFANAVAPRSLVASGCRTYCYLADAEAHGATGRLGLLKTTHWWGNKALYAIALRYLTVAEIRDLTLIATRLAYVFLGISLLLISPRLFLVGAPMLLLDAFSGIEYWADVANGLPYLWAILMVAVLALLMRTRMSFSGVLGCCFAGGTVSAYLWMGDGHTLLAVVWLGLLAWFRYRHADAGERAARAVSCIAFYTLGVVLSYGIAQLAKTAVLGFGAVWYHFSNGMSIVGRDAAQGFPELVSIASQLRALLEAYYTIAWPSDPLAGSVYGIVTVSALLVAVGLAVHRMRQGSVDSLGSVLWIVLLALAHSLPQFLITDHMPYRTARFMFVPHALCWSCLLLAIRPADWRFCSAMLGLLLSVTLFTAWYLSDRRSIGRLFEAAEDAAPVIASTFSVYREGNTLIYLKDDCSEEDLQSWIFVRVYAAEAADLPAWRWRHGFENQDFVFGSYDLRGGFNRYERRGGYALQAGARCVAVRTLPDYEIGRVETGQSQGDGAWRGVLRLANPVRAVDRLFAEVEDARPVVAAAFKVYRAGGKVVYTKEGCDGEDIGGAFFLHLYPADEADLPPWRAQYGFDNLDFSFEAQGYVGDGRCAAERALPDYEIARIHTGQLDPAGKRLWRGEAILAGRQQ